jgi:hypothetical protein
MRPRNWFISANAPLSLSVAASPESALIAAVS